MDGVCVQFKANDGILWDQIIEATEVRVDEMGTLLVVLGNHTVAAFAAGVWLSASPRSQPLTTDAP